jgi:hypothetical protein
VTGRQVFAIMQVRTGQWAVSGDAIGVVGFGSARTAELWLVEYLAAMESARLAAMAAVLTLAPPAGRVC